MENLFLVDGRIFLDKQTNCNIEIWDKVIGGFEDQICKVDFLQIFPIHLCDPGLESNCSEKTVAPLHRGLHLLHGRLQRLHPAQKVVLARMQLAQSVPVLLQNDAIGDHPHEPLVLEEAEQGVGGGVWSEFLTSHHPPASQALRQKFLHVQSQLNLNRKSLFALF